MTNRLRMRSEAVAFCLGHDKNAIQKEKSMAGIEKILVLSIIHISKKTSDAIAMNGGIGGLPAYPYERGHFMYIGDIEVRKIGDGKNREIVLLKSGQRLCDVSPEIIDCICAAVKRECQWILFDRHAEIERSLDTFIW